MNPQEQAARTEAVRLELEAECREAMPHRTLSEPREAWFAELVEWWKSKAIALESQLRVPVQPSPDTRTQRMADEAFRRARAIGSGVPLQKAELSIAERFMESLPARETFPIDRTETIEMLGKFVAWLNRSPVSMQAMNIGLRGALTDENKEKEQ